MAVFFTAVEPDGFGFADRRKMQTVQTKPFNITSKERVLTQASRKKLQLLHLAGLELYKRYKDLVDPGLINASTDEVRCSFSIGR